MQIVTVVLVQGGRFQSACFPEHSHEDPGQPEINSFHKTAFLRQSPSSLTSLVQIELLRGLLAQDTPQERQALTQKYRDQGSTSGSPVGTPRGPPRRARGEDAGPRAWRDDACGTSAPGPGACREASSPGPLLPGSLPPWTVRTPPRVGHP